MYECLLTLSFVFIELDSFVQNCHVFVFLCCVNYNVKEGP